MERSDVLKILTELEKHGIRYEGYTVQEVAEALRLAINDVRLVSMLNDDAEVGHDDE